MHMSCVTTPLAKCTLILLMLTGWAHAQPATQPASAPAAARSLPFRIAPDTTVITEPLLPNGLPDYLGAINARLSRGVTPANNAAVLLLQVMDPQDPLLAAFRERIYKSLGLQPPPRQTRFFKDFHESSKSTTFRTALESPWMASDYSELVQWLSNNRESLTRFAEAARCSRYYLPLLSERENGPMMVVRPRPTSHARTLAKAMIIRANLATGEGRADEAWADILACHRIGVLMEQDGTLIGRLVGIAIAALADEGTDNLAASGLLTAERARAIIRELRALPRAPTTPSAIETERYSALDWICRFAIDPGAYQQMLGELEFPSEPPGPRTPEQERIGRVLAAEVDFNHVLRRMNQTYDQFIVALKHQTYTEFRAAIDQFDESIARLKAQAEPSRMPTRSEPLAVPGQPNAKTVWFSNLMVAIFMPSLTRAEVLARRQLVMRDMAMVSVALNGYHAEKGAYPASLDALVPAWLEKVPVDFFSGKPLAYKPTERGYTVYSFGENARDDGGKSETEGGDDHVYSASR